MTDHMNFRFRPLRLNVSTKTTEVLFRFELVSFVVGVIDDYAADRIQSTHLPYINIFLI